MRYCRCRVRLRPSRCSPTSASTPSSTRPSSSSRKKSCSRRCGSAPESLTPKRVDAPRPGALAYLGMGWLGPKLDHADTPAVDLLVSILGQSRSSRLPQSLRERLALVNSVRSDYTALEAGGMIMVTAQLEPPNLARAEAEILREVQRLRERGVTDAELRRAITRAEAEHAFRSETAEGRARLLGYPATVWRCPP